MGGGRPVGPPDLAVLGGDAYHSPRDGIVAHPARGDHLPQPLVGRTLLWCPAHTRPTPWRARVPSITTTTPTAPARTAMSATLNDGEYQARWIQSITAPRPRPGDRKSLSAKFPNA